MSTDRTTCKTKRWVQSGSSPMLGAPRKGLWQPGGLGPDVGIAAGKADK